MAYKPKYAAKRGSSLRREAPTSREEVRQGRTAGGVGTLPRKQSKGNRVVSILLGILVIPASLLLTALLGQSTHHPAVALTGRRIFRLKAHVLRIEAKIHPAYRAILVFVHLQHSEACGVVWIGQIHHQDNVGIVDELPALAKVAFSQWAALAVLVCLRRRHLRQRDDGHAELLGHGVQGHGDLRHHLPAVRRPAWDELNVVNKDHLIPSGQYFRPQIVHTAAGGLHHSEGNAA